MHIGMRLIFLKSYSGLLLRINSWQWVNYEMSIHHVADNADSQIVKLGQRKVRVSVSAYKGTNAIDDSAKISVQAAV